MSCSSCKSNTCQERNRDCADQRACGCCAPRCDYVFEQTVAPLSSEATHCFPAVSVPESSTPSFGRSVAVSADGNILVAGSPFFDGNGAAFVYERLVSFSACACENDGKFQLVQVLTPETTDTSVTFGLSVAISGDGSRIAVGAPAESTGPSTLNGGVVYIFDRKHPANKKRCGPALWHRVQKVVAQRRASETDCTIVNDENSFGFGFPIALSRNGNVLMVGDVYVATPSAPSDSGFVYFYEDCSPPFATSPCASLECNPFVFRQRITQADVVADANDTDITEQNLGPIGNAVALSADGSVAAFGAILATVSSQIDGGRVFIYERCHHAQQWTYVQNVHSVETSENFGVALAMTPCAKYLVVEAPFRPNSSELGFATVFRRDGRCFVKIGDSLVAVDSDTEGIQPTQFSAAISDDGCVVAIGFELSTEVSQFVQVGNVVIFDRKSELIDGKCQTVWVRRQKPLYENPEEPNASFGFAVGMDAFGQTLAVGGDNAENERVTVFHGAFQPRRCSETK